MSDDFYLPVREKEFYLQDTRQIVGNDLMWWRDGGGYTSDVSQAEVFTKKRAFSQFKMRETDLPWPKEYVDRHTRPVVDHQYVDREVAMQEIEKELANDRLIQALS